MSNLYKTIMILSFSLINSHFTFETILILSYRTLRAKFTPQSRFIWYFLVIVWKSFNRSHAYYFTDKVVSWNNTLLKWLKKEASYNYLYSNSAGYDTLLVTLMNFTAIVISYRYNWINHRWSELIAANIKT